MPDNILERVKVHGRGRIQLPKEVRKLLEVEDGDYVYIVQNSSGDIMVRRAPSIIRGKY